MILLMLVTPWEVAWAFYLLDKLRTAGTLLDTFHSATNISTVLNTVVDRLLCGTIGNNFSRLIVGPFVYTFAQIGSLE